MDVISLVLDKGKDVAEILDGGKFGFKSKSFVVPKFDVESIPLASKLPMVCVPVGWGRQDNAGDVSVRVFRADEAFPQCVAPLHVWVKVTDMPFGLRNKDALVYLVHEYATLLESDMSSLTGSDIPLCLLLLEVADTEVLPSYQWIEYIRHSGAKHIFQIFLEVDQILPRSNSSGIGKRSTTYWRPMEPAPKQFAGEGSGSASVGSGGSLSSSMAKGGSETGIMGGGKPNMVKDQSVTGRGVHKVGMLNLTKMILVGVQLLVGVHQILGMTKVILV
jgi:hypothetical protein